MIYAAFPDMEVFVIMDAEWKRGRVLFFLPIISRGYGKMTGKHSGEIGL